MNSLKPSRIDFDSIDTRQIEQVLKTGDLSALSGAERAYYDMMELVRGLRARMLMPGGTRLVTKTGIIKLLKSDAYGLSDWTARRVYADALNFFYLNDGVSSKAWAGYYAERLDKLADLAVASGKLKEAKGYYVEAARLRGCYDIEPNEIPQELVDAKPVVIYTANPEDLGAPRTDRHELEAYIDSIPDVPELTRKRVKEDAGVVRRDIMARMLSDIKEFADEE